MNGDRVAVEGIDDENVELEATALTKLTLQEKTPVTRLDRDLGRYVFEIVEVLARDIDDVGVDLVEAPLVSGPSKQRDASRAEAQYGDMTTLFGFTISKRETHPRLRTVIKDRRLSSAGRQELAAMRDRPVPQISAPVLRFPRVLVDADDAKETSPHRQSADALQTDIAPEKHDERNAAAEPIEPLTPRKRHGGPAE